MSKHFEEDYNTLVKSKLLITDKHNAMAQSIGGNFYHFGIFQRELLLQQGLKENDTVLDIGCGSGRLANALKDMSGLTLIGIDVVDDLLDYAKELCQRDDWSFIKSTDFKIPMEDNSVDMVTCFSVFTHLLHEETYAYLAEVRRVLKPGGKIVFSFLDFSIAEHWSVFVSNLIQIEEHVHLNQFIDPQAIQIWCGHLDLTVEAIFSGNQPYIDLKAPVKGENGEVFEGKVSLGQSVCIAQKPENGKARVLAIPPAGFDRDRYLELNPDIAKAGFDPAVHFIAHGQFENRPIK
jgi:SAM-dependent methyltransferase